MKKSIFATFLVLLASSVVNLNADQPRLVGQTDSSHDQLLYGSFYTTSNDIIPPEHAINFDKQTVSPRGISHSSGSGEFFIPSSGVYRVTYSVALAACKGMVALKLDGNIIPGSEVCIATANELVTHTLLINVSGKSCCDHKLSLVNNYPLCDQWWNNSMGLQSCDPTCCAPDRNITASITIEKVADLDSGCGCKK